MFSIDSVLNNEVKLVSEYFSLLSLEIIMFFD